MIVIDMALDFVLEHQLFGEIWILSDSRRVIQYLVNWRDIPSHVNLKYHDIADSLAKEGTTMPQAHTEPLTYLELYSRRKTLFIISWSHPLAHSRYRSEGPGATIHFKGDRKDQTALARLSFGHLKIPRFSRGDKKFNICTK
ncbi:hypothetical protein AVEN_124411-1 [Araneus ventricosus]|uniref:RNase H type-1 domain-containing protein n=1 Tax=Araneus ventricosus TaxID=182803 RepID=A0A4Y2UNS1_ARAVE|nr:hypothetical protein AVEN_124411-1 [Araneus ventricosus]